MRTVNWTVRASPATRFFPVGRHEEVLPVEIEEHEEAWFAARTREIDRLPVCPERSALISEVCTILEVKALLGGRFLGSPEVEEEPLPVLPPDPGAPAPEPELGEVVQTTFLPPEGTDSVFQIPDKARRRLGYFEGDNDPTVNLAGKQHAPARTLDTERAAAELVTPRTGTQRARVLDYIGEAGQRGATDEEVAAGLGMLANTERPRRVELEEGGWVRDSGRRRDTASGTAAVVWELTIVGRSAWQPNRRATG